MDLQNSKVVMTYTEELLLAAESGRAEHFRYFPSNEDIDFHKDQHGNTLLSIAAQKGNKKLAHMLIRKGANINAKNKDSKTPLSYAAENGDIDVVRVLIAYDGRVEPDSYERAVSRAASNGYMHVLDVLLKHINSTEVEKYVSTAIESAAQAGQIPTLSQLHERYHLHPNLDAAFSNTLYLAALNGRENLVEHLLGIHDIDINYKGPVGRTALHVAAQKGDTKTVELLLQMDEIDINAQDEDRWTPLHLVAETDHMEMLKLLLTRDEININIQGEFDKTALHLAAEKGLTETVALLLAKDALGINAQDENGHTALYLAASRGHDGMTKLLLERDQIDINVQDKYGQTAFGIAVDLRRTLVVDLLLNSHGFDFDAAGVSLYSVVRLAVNDPFGFLMESLLDKERVACPGQTLLLWCAENGEEEALERLIIRHGADANSKDDSGRTPLSLGSENGHSRVVQTLLDYKADANSKDDNGRTPLSLGSENGHDSVVEMLLKYKADANSKDDSGRTPLSLSSENGYYTVVKMLLQYNADENSKDDNGRTPLSLSSENGHDSVVEMLLKYKADANSRDGSGRTSLSLSAENGHVGVVNTLLLCNADPNLQDGGGRTPLWWAVKNGHAACAKQLTPVDTGALLLLTQEGNQDAIEFLLRFNPKLDQRNHHGRTALHQAVLLGHLDIAKSIILKGAETSPRDNFSMTPLQLAIQRKNDEFIQLLLQNKASIKGIMAKEWRDIYGKQGADILLLSETPYGARHLDFPETFLTSEELSQTSTESKSRLYVLTDDLNSETWSKVPIKVAQQLPVLNQLQITEIINNNTLDISISLRLTVNRHIDGPPSGIDTTKASRIMWRAIQPINPGSPWIPVTYFSTLPYGWIPDDGADLFEQFLTHIKAQWLELCHKFGEYLSNMRLEQLESKGKSSKITDCLANDAQRLAELRTILAGQTSEAEKFMNKYCAHYNANQVPQSLRQLLKDDIEIGINKKIEELDQTVRDLLQIEFAWITIHETRISTKLGQNVMLLTYVSIFYLPLGFCAALWAIPNITDNGTRAPFIVTATMVSVVTLLVTFNMEKIAAIIQRVYQYGRNYIAKEWDCIAMKWEETKDKQYPALP